MSNRKPSPYFTNPCLIPIPQATRSSFEQVVHLLHLTPEQYAVYPN